MRTWVLILVLLLAAMTTVAATAAKRAYSFTKASDRYFSDAEYSELIRTATREVAEARGVPATVFDSRYPGYQTAVEKRSKAGIQQAFKWVEFTEGTADRATLGSSTFNKQKQLYTEQLQKAVRRALDGYEWRGLLEFDQSDRIVLFTSVVHVYSDRSQRVVEQITIYNGNGEQAGERMNSLNNDIQRGIYRQIPTRYTTAGGFQKDVPLSIISVQRNGSAEPWVVERLDNGYSLRIGDAASFLPVGKHTYRIEYETAEQVGLFEDFDELYWNATGNDWSFRIDSAACEIHFPLGARIVQQKCYTGVQGSTESACVSQLLSDSAVRFSTTKLLAPGEGFTVAAGIQKLSAAGKIVLTPPSATQQALSFLRDNILIGVMAAVLVVVALIDFAFWRKVGRDPRSRTIHPEFEPPKGLSPSEVGYIIDQEFGSHLAAAALVDAVVNRQITVEVGEGGVFFKHPVYTIRKIGDGKKTPYKSFGDESSLSSIGSIEKGRYNRALKDFANAVRTFVEEQHLSDPSRGEKKKKLFAHNSNAGIAGVLLLVFSVIGSIIYMGANGGIAAMHAAAAAAFFVAAIVVHAVFMRIMSAYTTEGRAIADSILGFKMYLETAEQLRLDALAPPERTLELYERYLPFAVALKVENRWAEQFKDIISDAAVDSSAAVRSSSFRSWYSSSMASTFASNLSSTISSASTPPGTSSGSSSSGGSSGGGGGGGGGGGW